MEDELPPAKHDNQLRTSLDGGLDSVSPQLPESCSANLHWPKHWRVFRPYLPPDNFRKRHNLPVLFRKSPLVRLTKDLAVTYKICNTQFWYSEELKPKRYLTIPSAGVLNNGHDNANADLILSVNYSLINIGTHRRYVVKDILGHGTFGQVAKCWIEESRTFVAVKIIKNEPAYYQQALVEVSILAALNKKYDPDDQHHIVRILDYFVHNNHLCISFELLDMNLYSLIKINNFRGLSLNIVQLFSKQILMGLSLMKNVGIIHCDLKPENILLCTSDRPDNVKIIDFGSACLEDHTVYSYIQSRYYRSPEAILGYQYTTAIDMWSFGCIVAELFLGLPLFAGASEFDLLRRMINIRGGHPPDHVLKEAKNTNKYFKFIGSVCFMDNGGISVGRQSSFRALTIEEFEMRELKKPLIGKEYFSNMNIDEIVKNYPYGKLLPEQDIAKETQTRLALLDFLKGLVEFDPAKRWSPFQASQHPFVTGAPFTCPYNPPRHTPHIVVSQSMKIHHHPGGGHWLAAGISPGMAGRKWGLSPNSPFIQMVPHGHANNFGSLGSHSSYGDSLIGTSYGSYGDCSDIFTYFSPVGSGARNLRDRGSGSMLGTSPDSKPRFSRQQPHGNGNLSPSASAVSPLVLGSSPSCFTPPKNHRNLSVGSPGNYCPASPKGSTSYGTPFEKTARANPFTRSLVHNGQVMPSREMPLFPHRQSNFSDVPAEGVRPLVPIPISFWQSSPVDNSLKEPVGYGDSTSSLPTLLLPGSSSTYSSFRQNKQVMHLHETPANESMPTPSDWDPNYSDDLLLQEDDLEVDSLASDFNIGVTIPPSFSRGKMFDDLRRPTFSSFNRSQFPAQEKKSHSPGVSSLPLGHVPQTRYTGPLSKSSNLNPGKAAIPPGMKWSQMHFHSPSQLFSGHMGGNSAVEIPRSPPRGRKGCERIG